MCDRQSRMIKENDARRAISIENNTLGIEYGRMCMLHMWGVCVCGACAELSGVASRRKHGFSIESHILRSWLSDEYASAIMATT